MSILLGELLESQIQEILGERRVVEGVEVEVDLELCARRANVSSYILYRRSNKKKARNFHRV